MGQGGGTVTMGKYTGKVVEADETYIGRKPGCGRSSAALRPQRGEVFYLWSNGAGQVRSFHITGPMFDGIKKALKEKNVRPGVPALAKKKPTMLANVSQNRQAVRRALWGREPVAQGEYCTDMAIKATLRIRLKAIYSSI